jgi:hypothetical protein
MSKSNKADKATTAPAAPAAPQAPAQAKPAYLPAGAFKAAGVYTWGAAYRPTKGPRVAVVATLQAAMPAGTPAQTGTALHAALVASGLTAVQATAYLHYLTNKAPKAVLAPLARVS